MNACALSGLYEVFDQEDITMGGNCCRHGGQNWFVADYPMVIP